jgi:phage protein U
MFSQLGTILFDGLQTFVSYSESEEMAIAEFARINTKPKLMAGGIGLVGLELSIFLHAEFTPGSVADEIAKFKTSLESFEILPLLWGNGETGGEWVIKSMQVEYSNLDAQGNVYEARLNLSLLESIADNKAQQEQQNAANNAFAAGNKTPVTKSKRKNAQSCPRSIAALIQEIQQFGNVVNQIVPVYTGDQTQAAKVNQACTVISEDCSQIEAAVNDPKSCVYQNTPLQQQAHSVNLTAQMLGGDIVKNARAVNGISVQGAQDGATIMAENTGLQGTIKQLVAVAQPIIKTSITQ